MLSVCFIFSMMNSTKPRNKLTYLVQSHVTLKRGEKIDPTS